ncbi:histidinolphosphatase [Borealophlyctis nickersoniae]|nr:histidinolphosphatase [Borealophlyctis nickersoniae]
MISFHSHSGEYCKHAKGSLEDVVKKAIDMGFVAYGLSEHMPRTRQQDLYPEEIEANLTPADTSEMFKAFVTHARTLQTKYQDKIKLYVGMETEHIHSHTLNELTQLQNDHTLDYIVGSVHHVHEIPIDFDQDRYTLAEAEALKLNPAVQSATDALFLAYFDAQHEMLVSAKPMVVGHFDLIRMYRPTHPLSPALWEKIDRNIDLIVSYGGLVEINSRAWKKGLTDAYPQRDILKRMIAKGIRFTLSDDSHGPDDVGMHYNKLYAYLREMDINTLHAVGHDSDGNPSTTVQVFENALSHSFWRRFDSKIVKRIHEC